MRQIFEPRSVVLVGVSRQTGEGAYNGLEMMLRYGYQGKLFVVHPQADDILGRQPFRRVQDLPEVPELAVVAVGRDRVLPVVEDCLGTGVRWIIIISQGFGDADATGRALQTQIVSRAADYGARIIGPNTMGTLNVYAGFSTAFVDIPRHGPAVPVSLIAQSGAPQVGSESFTGLLGKAIDLGNAADVGFLDVLEYFETDPLTQVIAIHMEGLTQGREFLEVASRINLKKPVVIFKTGTSTAGARAALSHTGSLVGEDAVFAAALERAGLTRVYGAPEMVDTVLGFRKLPPLHGPRIGVVTASGALGIMTADALSREGLELGDLPQGLRQGLEPQGPYWHKLHNPVDLWPIGMFTGDFLAAAEEAITGLLASPEIDGVIGILPSLASPLHRNIVPTPDFIARLHLARFGKPLALALYGDYREQLAMQLEETPGVAGFASVEASARVFRHLWVYGQTKIRPLESWTTVRVDTPAGIATSEPGEVRLGNAALDFLEHLGLPVLQSRLTQSPEEAVAAAETLGYPVVLKVVSPQWVHKSDRGGVLLRLERPDQVVHGFRRLEEAVRQGHPPAHLEGILVQPYRTGKEVLLGLKQDATFGPVVVCGQGGVYTELYKDVVQTLAPVSVPQARDMLSRLRMFPLLTGFRGEPAVAVEDVAQVLAALSEVAGAVPTIRELDINPLTATPTGCWAVDARIVFT